MDAAQKLLHTISYMLSVIEYEIINTRICYYVGCDYGQNTIEYEETYNLVEVIENVTHKAHNKFIESIVDIDIVRRNIIIDVVERTFDVAYNAISNAIDIARVDDDNIFEKNILEIYNTLVFNITLYNYRNKNDAESGLVKADATNRLYALIRRDRRLNDFSIAVINAINKIAVDFAFAFGGDNDISVALIG